jgi:hypothetical protein
MFQAGDFFNGENKSARRWAALAAGKSRQN